MVLWKLHVLHLVLNTVLVGNIFFWLCRDPAQCVDKVSGGKIHKPTLGCKTHCWKKLQRSKFCYRTTDACVEMFFKLFFSYVSFLHIYMYWMLNKVRRTLLFLGNSFKSHDDCWFYKIRDLSELIKGWRVKYLETFSKSQPFLSCVIFVFYITITWTKSLFKEIENSWPSPWYSPEQNRARKTAFLIHQFIRDG